MVVTSASVRFCVLLVPHWMTTSTTRLQQLPDQKQACHGDLAPHDRLELVLSECRSVVAGGPSPPLSEPLRRCRPGGFRLGFNISVRAYVNFSGCQLNPCCAQLGTLSLLNIVTSGDKRRRMNSQALQRQPKILSNTRILQGTFQTQLQSAPTLKRNPSRA